ncbi:RNA methyltransferase [Niveibacterium umoris]|uniref:TrmH family RNA methyltransferase n=1 Tax=Niveibacterium umoris TaxID=1193620 RepID=A0A840BEQ7_9RHOO|nr:RNA methyltransferase [Niveibacterium umoris]MBB4011510.1 TrmH family RNA methyltransferase [Niveibacterium umoris]
MLKPITSRDNPLLKRLRKLSESARTRREEGVTVLDGVHLVEAAIAASRSLGEIVIAESARETTEVSALLVAAKPTPCFVLPDPLFRTISPVETPAGILATVQWTRNTDAPDPFDDWLVLDGVQDAGNVGTMLRTAAAAGVRAAVLGPGCAQAWGPKVLRAGMGAHFHLHIHETENLVALLRGYPGTVMATRLDGATSLFERDLRGASAWVFGAEGQGLSAEVAALARHGILIPMAEGVESLNVAAAAAICLFEQRRQRATAAS